MYSQVIFHDLIAHGINRYEDRKGKGMRKGGKIKKARRNIKCEWKRDAGE